MIDIRRCRKTEIGILMQFIDQHWQPGHILSTNRDLLEWQHKRDDSCELNVLGAWRDDELLGVLGYIPSHRFSKMRLEENVLWLALWKVRDDSGVAGLGLRLLRELAVLEKNVGLAVNGIALSALPIYRALGWHVGEVRQFFSTNPSGPMTLISNPTGLPLPVPQEGTATFIKLSRDDLMSMEPSAFAATIPPKSPRYFIERFLKHPFYDYTVYRVDAPGCGSALLATRYAMHGDARALRIVDFAGNGGIVAQIGPPVATLMRENGAEFADFCQFGLSALNFAKAGFMPLDPEGPIGVPTYFEPFVAESQRVHYGVKNLDLNSFVVCRADGDQDRPNLIAEP